MATATAGTQVLHEKLDLTICSICLENFKSPIYLPCAHTFCQICLSTHIKATCSKKENDDQPLGFPCPLCRAFVPAPGAIGQFPLDKWVSQFPENEHLSSLVRKGDSFSQILCNPCNREGKENEARSLCKECTEALCEDCFTSHKKFKSSFHHERIPLHENFIEPSPNFNMDICEIHKGRKIDMFCENHFTPCCVLCATKEHRSCQSMCPIEEVAEKLSPERVKCLQGDMDVLDDLLETVIKEEKSNLADIDDVADKTVNDIMKTKDKIIESMKRLEEKHLNEVAKLSKEAKAKLEKSIEALEQRRCYLQYWKEATGKNLSCQESSKSAFVLSYVKLEQIFQKVRKLEMSKLEIGMKSTMHNHVRELIDLPCLTEISLQECKESVILKDLSMKHAKVQIISDFKIKGADLQGGVFLRNNGLLLTDHVQKKLIRCRTDGVILKEVAFQNNPWDVSLCSENHIFVTFPEIKEILLMKTDSLDIVKRITFDCKCFGISQSGNTIAVGCLSAVEVLDMNFQKLRKTNNVNRVYDVAVDMEENIIYSSFNDNFVRKENRKGNVLFTYNHEELKSPYGLTVDRFGMIYVNSMGKSNIHILTPKGKQLRILNEVGKPQCINFQEYNNQFFVGEESGRVKIFQYNA